jgi:septum formation protein
MILSDKYKLILGSKSPRRSQLMQEAGYKFEIRTQNIDESFLPTMPVLVVAEDLAIRKAAALFNTLTEDEVLVTADSVVVLDNAIYNKPADYQEGFDMIRRLSGHKHIVATGVAITSTSKNKSFTVITNVHFGDFSDIEIDFYINTFKPYDKAGGYGIQDWIGLCKIKSIEGSYSNVMGLPMYELYNELKEYTF